MNLKSLLEFDMSVPNLLHNQYHHQYLQNQNPQALEWNIAYMGKPHDHHQPVPLLKEEAHIAAVDHLASSSSSSSQFFNLMSLNNSAVVPVDQFLPQPDLMMNNLSIFPNVSAPNNHCHQYHHHHQGYYNYNGMDVVENHELVDLQGQIPVFDDDDNVYLEYFNFNSSPLDQGGVLGAESIDHDPIIFLENGNPISGGELLLAGEGGNGDGSIASIGSSGSAASDNLGFNNKPIRLSKSSMIRFEDISKYFYMTITDAAKMMNVGLTVLKKRCRELGISRWPHRKMKSMKSLIHNVQELGKTAPAEDIEREIRTLEEHKRLMEQRPELQMTDRTKKLRQACFKANYKRRRARQFSPYIDGSNNIIFN